MNFRHVNLDFFLRGVSSATTLTCLFRLVENLGAVFQDVFMFSSLIRICLKDAGIEWTTTYAFPGSVAYHYQGNDARFDQKGSFDKLQRLYCVR